MFRTFPRVSLSEAARSRLRGYIHVHKCKLSYTIFVEWASTARFSTTERMHGARVHWPAKCTRAYTHILYVYTHIHTYLYVCTCVRTYGHISPKGRDEGQGTRDRGRERDGRGVQRVYTRRRCVNGLSYYIGSGQSARTSVNSPVSRYMIHRIYIGPARATNSPLLSSTLLVSYAFT